MLADDALERCFVSGPQRVDQELVSHGSWREQPGIYHTGMSAFGQRASAPYGERRTKVKVPKGATVPADSTGKPSRREMIPRGTASALRER